MHDSLAASYQCYSFILDNHLLNVNYVLRTGTATFVCLLLDAIFPGNRLQVHEATCWMSV